MRPHLLLLFVFTASTTASAQTRGPAESAYEAFVQAVAVRARVLSPQDGTRRWEASLQTAEDVRVVSVALDTAVSALARAQGSDRPRALELEERLTTLRRGLSMVAALGVDPGELVQAHVRMVQDAGGWDSVVWGERAYPAVSGDVSVVLKVPVRWLPVESAADPVHVGCEQARFEPWRDEDVARSPAKWGSYLQEVKRFVPAALRTAHLPKLPEALVVLDPPDAVFSRAMEPAGRALPFAVRTVPVSEWADQTPSPDDGPARRKAFRDAWRELQQTAYAREYRGNCALIAQKLVAEALEPVVNRVQLERRRRLLGPWLRPYAQRAFPLRLEPTTSAAVVAKIDRGEEVETLDGVIVDELTGQLTVSDWIRVRTTAGLEGWLPSATRVAWVSPTRKDRQAVTVLAPEPPDSLDEVIHQLDRQADAWHLSIEAARHLVGAKAADSKQQAADQLELFCQLKASLTHEVGPAGLAEASAKAQARRRAEGQVASRVETVFAGTWSAKGCGSP